MVRVPLVVVTALTLKVLHVKADRVLRFEQGKTLHHEATIDAYRHLHGHRLLAGGGDGDGEKGSEVCHKSGSFLGVGNVDCLHENLGTAIFLLTIIIVVSLLFERIIQAVRNAIACPQLKKIVNRIFEEVMIMGFISMVIFTLNTTGLLEKFHFTFSGGISGKERLHFYEFFHYLVFLTMIYFILIVLFLLFVGTVVPKLIWEIKNNPDDSDSDEDDDDLRDSGNDLEDDVGDALGRNRNSSQRTRDRDRNHSWMGPTSRTSDNLPFRASVHRGRANSGMDLVQGSRAYALLLQRYQREGWSFMFNLKKQWHLWKSFEILAYNMCQHRSGYIYKNPSEMDRLFAVRPQFHSDGRDKPLSYDRYNILCMRNLLFHISHLHYSAFFVLLIIVVVPVLYPAYDHWIFIGVGVVLLLVNVVIFFKVLQILRGIVDDRLRIFTSREIQSRMHHRPRTEGAIATTNGMTMTNATVTKRKPPSFRVVAQSVRAVIRMQMSALCHHQLHYHNDRFWFNSPRFLLRLFHFATIGQAFYLVWFSLVEYQTVASTSTGVYLICLMALLPFLAMCVITPMTMPSLVLVMSLTGIFVELNGNDPHSGIRATPIQTKTRIRLMRRSYLRSHYTDTEETNSSVAPQSGPVQRTIEASASPTSVFLRMYDSPKAAAQHAKLLESASPRRAISGDRDDGAPLMRRSASGDAFSSSHSEDVADYTRTRRSFDLSSCHLGKTTVVPGNSHRKASLDSCYPRFSPRPITSADAPQTESSRESTPPISPAFKNYCSKYGGYPDA